jgi:hypothetical protein
MDESVVVISYELVLRTNRLVDNMPTGQEDKGCGKDGEE